MKYAEFAKKYADKSEHTPLTYAKHVKQYATYVKKYGEYAKKYAIKSEHTPF